MGQPPWRYREELRSSRGVFCLEHTFSELSKQEARVPVSGASTMSGLVDDSLQTDRFVELLSETFGFLAMLLASIGLYGIMVYRVARTDGHHPGRAAGPGGNTVGA
jgi:hypothetical protein